MPEHKLTIANQELAFQNEEKEKRAAELVIANKELIFQNEEKEKRAAELIIANKELAFQNEEKEKRAAELVIANKELIFQNKQKEDRAAELIIANQELAFQNEEKEKRAAELIIANKELIFQNEQKEDRAAELIIANKELAFQNEEKEKRAAELIIAYKELESFNYIASHDLQEPLRKLQVFTSSIVADEYHNLSDKGKRYLNRMRDAAIHMQDLIIDLRTYTGTNNREGELRDTDLNKIIEKVKIEFKEIIDEKRAVIEVSDLCNINVIPSQFRQVMHHLIDNALKFSRPGVPPHIIIKNRIIKYNEVAALHLSAQKEYCHICITDNGTGFDPRYKDHIFEIFKKVHDDRTIAGTGMGLAIVKKIVENHKGMITATSEINKGTTFDIYIPSI